jgi:hypothetical protein
MMDELGVGLPAAGSSCALAEMAAKQRIPARRKNRTFLLIILFRCFYAKCIPQSVFVRVFVKLVEHFDTKKGRPQGSSSYANACYSD